MPFSPSSTHTSQGEDDNLPAYTVTSLNPKSPLAPKKPHIVHVYSWCEKPPTSSSPLNPSPAYEVSYDDLSISRLGKRQYVFPISTFVSYNLLSSYYRYFIFKFYHVP